MELRTIICVFVLVTCRPTAGQRRPPNYSLDEMPDIQTSFSCYDKILGGYYSDPETDCQMFHVCVRVAGVGVQDFRFLCPNDTAFDQENQICDDWYNIDCEAATLYYSDNFDLFRLGPDDVNFNSVKPTPIPLGPSSAPRLAPHPKPRRPHAPVNNAVSETDDDLYRDDHRQPQDLLRGSSSGNFFNNRNGGKEDPDDDYVAASQAREQELVKGGKKKNKNQVRKLLTGKRPLATVPSTAAPTAAPTTAPTVPYYNRYNTVQRGRPSPTPTSTTTTENYPSTAVAGDFTRQRYNQQQQEDFQRFRGNQNFAFNKKPVVTSTEYVQDTTTTAPTYYQNRGNNFYQQSSAAPAFNNYYQTQSSSTAAPTSYKGNYNQGNNYYQTQTTPAPTNYNNNYYQTQTTQAPQYNYNQQTSTPASTIYNAYNAASRVSQQTTANNNNANYNQNNNYQYNAQSTVNTNGNYEATTLKQNYFQKQTTANYESYKTSTSVPVAPYSTTQAPNYNYDDTASVFQQTKNQYNLNVNAAGTTYNPYNSYKGSNDGYDEPSAGESLKTAPSSNIRPSDLNAIAKSYQKPAAPVGFNASLTASYNFANAATTQQPASKFFSSPKQFQTTVKPVQQPSSRGNAFYAQSTTVSSQARPFSKVPETKAPPKKEKDASYDYAYYDEGTASEYDGIDSIGEEFHRTTHKHGRTTPQ